LGLFCQLKREKLGTREVKFYRFILIITLILSFYVRSDQDYSEREDVANFIKKMVEKHGFNQSSLTKTLKNSKYQEVVIRIMNRQPEGTMTWSRYRNIMINDRRINSGKEFIKTYKEDLLRAESLYGVPGSVIASIIGIETRYGKIQGNIRVVDSLMTLAFDYPRREKFFRTQLEEFLLLSREENFEMESIKGSIAGAMGYGQFMPDSYRDYAVDFDDDGIRDLLGNPVDAIGSVANFLSKKGKWTPNTPIAIKAMAKGGGFDLPSSYKVKSGEGLEDIATKFDLTVSKIAIENNLRDVNFIRKGQVLKIPRRQKLKSNFKPYLTLEDSKKLGIYPSSSVIGNLKVTPVELELDDGFEYWLGFDNYYSLSKYNRSKLYVMAVFEFSNALNEFF